VSGQFRVGISRDFLTSDGRIGFGDIGLDALDADPAVSYEFLTEHAAELPASAVAGYDALLLLAPRITAGTLRGNGRLKLIARFGVGYDSIDIGACTRAGVLVTITPDGVRRPVAAAALTFILALAHRLLDKDRLTREGRFADRISYLGMGLTGRTLGTVGCGNTARELFTLAAPLGMRHIASDPYADPQAAAAAGIELVSLDALLRAADVVCVMCALTPDTRRLLDGDRLRLMKPTAYLVNVARGPIVDTGALVAALRDDAIAGAALDVFDPEPLPAGHPLLHLPNVLLAPHSLCWTDEMARGNGRSACEAILDVAHGRLPRHPVNPEAAADRPATAGAAPDTSPAGPPGTMP
jgi:phosphoglycerate dehydrogenase-like enzyme